MQEQTSRSRDAPKPSGQAIGAGDNSIAHDGTPLSAPSQSEQLLWHLQDLVTAERVLQEEQVKSEQQLQTIEDFANWYYEQQNHYGEIQTNFPGLTNTALKQLRSLEERAGQITKDRRHIEGRLASAETVGRKAQKGAIQAIDEILVDGDKLASAKATAPTDWELTFGLRYAQTGGLDELLETSYPEPAPSQRYKMVEGSEISTSKWSTSTPMPSRSPSWSYHAEVARDQAANEYAAAYSDFVAQDAAFDNSMEYERDQIAQYNAKLDRFGQVSETSVEFDHRMLRYKISLTKRLKQTEERLIAAKRKVEDLNVDAADDSDGAASESSERLREGALDSIDASSIEKWLRRLVKAQSQWDSELPMSPGSSDNGMEDQELETWESASVVASPGMKKRVADWRAQCEGQANA